jgi:MFS family permease
MTACNSINIFVWAIALASHAACKNFAGLLVVRLLLGVCEGSITAGFLIVSSMFYTRTEQTLRVGYWCKFSNSQMVGKSTNQTRGSLVLMNGTGALTKM